MLFNKIANIPRPLIYVITFVLVLLALLANGLLNSHLKSSIYFLPLTMVCLSAIWFGTLPGLLATLFTLAGIKMKLFEPSIAASHIDELRFFLFLPAGVLISFLGGSLRRSLQAAVESRHKAETSLRLLEEEKRTRDIIIAGLSHDLRNPIAAARISNEYVIKNTALTNSGNSGRSRPPFQIIAARVPG